MDLKKFKEDYDAYGIPEKMETVLALLQPLKGKGGNFDTIFNLLAYDPQLVTESDLNEIFSTLLIGMYQDGQDKMKIAEARLDIIKDKLVQMKEQEKIEKSQENPDSFLAASFAGI